MDESGWTYCLFRTGFCTNTSKFLIINLNGTSESMAQHIKAGVGHPSEKILTSEGKKGSFILIIDDEPDICKLLQLSLVKHGYNVKYVHALTEGMQYLQQQQPDLLFLDIHLPDGSGLEALPAIKKKCPALPVITISAYDNGMEKQKALNAGASYFMAKPFNVTNLDELMSNMLSQK
ncbi:response regulator transcription factor [Chitinophaga sp. S165]|uniref:response regulator transcription factor n=1 Tax=Chitinophaga sp. S165 TaxID=2135462 RepID=UPI001E608084|nr:response regulator [Chitinophaga sp. S165]